MIKLPINVAGSSDKPKQIERNIYNYIVKGNSSFITILD